MLEATSLFQSLFGGVDPFEDFLDSASQGAAIERMLKGRYGDRL